MKSNKVIIMAVFLAVVLAMMSNNVNAEVIGNREIIDTARFYVSSPYVIFPWTEQAEYEFMSKEFTGNIDFMVGFDSELIKPKIAELYVGGEWLDVSSAFNSIDYDYEGMNKWYYTQGVSIVQDTTYRFRINYDFIGHGNGKYWVCAKPSAQTLEQAITNGNFLCLDPLWNGLYSYRMAHYGNLSALSGDTEGYVPIISYINGSKEIYDCYVMINQTNRTFAYTYFNNYTDYTCYDPDGVTPLTTLINQGNGTSSFTDNNGSIIAWWSMGNCDDTNCYDIGADGLDGSKTSPTNPATVGEYIIGSATDYTGVRNEGLTVANDNALDLATGDSYTSSMWINPEASVEAYECMYRRSSASNEFIIGSSQQLSWTFWNDTNARITTVTANGFITYSNDYHLVNVYDSSTGSAKIYSNTSDVTSSATPSSNTRNDGGVFSIGYYDGGTVAFKNYIDELKLFRTAWTEDQIKLDFYASQFPFFNGSFEINTTPDSVPSVNVTYNYTTRYCEDSTYLHVIEKDLSDTGQAVFNEYLIQCPYGCGEVLLGEDCIMSDFFLDIIAIPILLIGGFIILYFPRFIKKKKKNRF